MISETTSNRFLKAVADALGILLEPGAFLENTTAFLGKLGVAAGVDRAYYFENNSGDDPLTCSQRCEWVHEGISRELHNPLMQNLCYETMLPGMLSSLAAGSSFTTLTANADSPLKEILVSQRIQSIALMPVHSQSEFIGFIGFDDCGEERIWQTDELEALRAAAAGLGGAIQRRRMEDSMSARAEELGRSRRVALSLMEDAQKAVAAAEKANIAKSSFLAMMSHEIRTPLNGVIGFTDLLLAEDLPPRQAEIVSTIRSCGNSLLGLISDILDLSKIESGKLELETAPCSVRECLRDVIVAFDPVLTEKHLTITTHCEDSVPGSVQTDAKRFRQILFNLVGNAVKFTNRGWISVRMSAGPQSRGRLMLACEVSDSGIGIPEAEQETIFEAFGQADSSIHRRFGGTGLGLTICRNLISAMGGKISLRSARGDGATFTFSIPVTRVEYPEEPQVAAGAEPADPVPPLRILAVDDVPTNTILMTGILRKLGAEPATASNGQNAFEQVQREPFDIVFMDVLMPVCDGVEATRRIREMERADPGRKPAYIIALTADAFSENRERCFAAGMDEFLTKPLRMETIRAAIARGSAKVCSAG
ncbi:MAG: response regulator [Verrucomicrobiaceae bacterium]|nr:MAG: response regulator [Verrucomicrobiaceae bacterium]